MRTISQSSQVADGRPRGGALRMVAAFWWAGVATASLFAAESVTDSPPGPAASVQSPPVASEIAERIPDKVRRYAERLLRRYDANGDGKLQRGEWSKMHGNPDAADVNADGVITLGELTNWIAAFGRNRRLGTAGDSPGASPRDRPDSQAADASGAGKEKEGEGAAKGGLQSETGPSPRRGTTFYVPKTRLPAGLPSWFLDRDLDGDGQLSLAEFAPNPTQADLEEFARFDRNGDGFITAKEGLEALRPAKPAGRKAAAGKSAGKSDGKSARPKNAGKTSDSADKSAAK
jgi:Ca2+-binding EF-hand superfamily protein